MIQKFLNPFFFSVSENDSLCLVKDMKVILIWPEVFPKELLDKLSLIYNIVTRLVIYSNVCLTTVTNYEYTCSIEY